MGIVLGDPVSWFRARDISGATVELHVSAGRWIVLAFMRSLSEPHAQSRLADLIRRASACSEDHMVIYVVLAELPGDIGPLRAASGPTMRFIADYDGAVGEQYDAHRSPRTIVLDPMLRAVANIPCSPPQEHDRILGGFLHGLPSVDNSSGVPLNGSGAHNSSCIRFLAV